MTRKESFIDIGKKIIYLFFASQNPGTSTFLPVLATETNEMPNVLVGCGGRQPFFSFQHIPLS